MISHGINSANMAAIGAACHQAGQCLSRNVCVRDARSQETDRCSYVLSRPFGFGFGRRSVICSARCSALVRDRPTAVMTLRWPRRSRMSQVRPGGCPPGAGGAGIDLNADGWHGCFLGFSGRCSGRGCWVADKTGTGRSGVEGKLLLGHAASRQADGAGDGRRIVRRPAGAAADYRVRPSPGQVGVSGRRGGGGRSRGRRNA
jgi:hypothetical protein